MKNQVRTAIPEQLLELGAVVQPILQRPQLTNQACVASVADRAEVLGIKLRKKRITIVQVRIMPA
jgi:transcriptional regulator of nitric oxide reductase